MEYSKKHFLSVFLLIFSLSFISNAQTKVSHKAQTVIKILESAERYKKLTNGLAERIKKNGGQSYGIMFDGSPNPKADFSNSFSKTYDLNLHESYKDRMVVIARFVFDPAKQQLFEFNSEDELSPLKFDRKLLSIFNKK